MKKHFPDHYRQFEVDAIYAKQHARDQRPRSALVIGFCQTPAKLFNAWFDVEDITNALALLNQRIKIATDEDDTRHISDIVCRQRPAFCVC